MRLQFSVIGMALGLLACGNSAGTPSFDEAGAAFLDALCTSPCVGDNEAECRSDVTIDLADIEAELDAAGEARCARCLDVKADILATLATCQASPDQDAAVAAACDLDPAVDFDGDGTADNDDDEACIGLP
jgi:hypothetical protein